MPKKTSTPKDSPRPARDSRAPARRKALRQVLDAAGMTLSDAARAAGLPTPNALYNFMHGRSGTLSQRTLEALAEVIPGATIAALVGIDPPDQVGSPQRPIQVRAAACAGLMQTSFDLPAMQQSQIVTTVAETMYAQGVFGVEVRSPGAELLFAEGTVLICIPMTSWEGPITSGKRLILQRIRGSRVEVTVREIVIEADEAWLWLRSSHPEHQTPIPMPYTPGQAPQAWRSGEDRYSIAAVVVLAVVPQP